MLTVLRCSRGPYIEIGRFTKDERNGTKCILTWRGMLLHEMPQASQMDRVKGNNKHAIEQTSEG